MSSAPLVPETAAARGLDASDARTVLRRHGIGSLAKDAVRRFRAGDGTASARALGLQLCLAVIPLVIALVGLSRSLSAGDLGELLRRTLLGLTPGSGSDTVDQALERSANGGAGAEVALWVGLATALLASTAAMAQVERGSNRIYGMQTDRPTVRRYLRAAGLALAAALPAIAGFLLVVGGGALGRALEQVYGLSETVVLVLRWPGGLLLMLVSVTLLLKLAPRRRQPGMSWLTVGAGVATLLWLVTSGLLALYVAFSDVFGQVYGPLTGVVALLLWSGLTGAALFLGVAFAAALEDARARAGGHRGDRLTSGGLQSWSSGPESPAGPTGATGVDLRGGASPRSEVRGSA